MIDIRTFVEVHVSFQVFFSSLLLCFIYAVSTSSSTWSHVSVYVLLLMFPPPSAGLSFEPIVYFRTLVFPFLSSHRKILRTARIRALKEEIEIIPILKDIFFVADKIVKEEGFFFFNQIKYFGAFIKKGAAR